MTFPLRSFLTADLIKPGACVLTRRHPHQPPSRSNIRHYWLAVVCTQSMLPASTLRTKPAIGATVQNGPFPVWLIGRSEFLWVSRAEIYHFSPSHHQAYRRADPTSDFMTYFTLANDNDGDLDFWRNAILEHKKKIDARDDIRTVRDGQKGLKRRKVVLDLDNSGDPDYQYTESDDSHLEDSEYEGPIRKKPRTFSSCTAENPNPRSGKSRAEAGHTRLIAPSPPPSMLGPITPPSTSVSASAPSSSTTSQTTASSTTLHQPGPGPGAVFIKPEPSDKPSSIPFPDEEMVDVFIGPTNTKFPCSRTDLLQSTVLSSRITTRRNTTTNHQTGGSFIMDPTFSSISPRNFEAVIQFLQTNEYEPLLLREPNEGKYMLDDSNAPIDYSKEFVRSADLINLGKRFQLPRFADLVFRKILLGHPGGRYGIKAFLEFAKTILGERDQQDVEFDCGGEGAGAAEDEREEGTAHAQGKEAAAAKKEIWSLIQGWAIRFLAENMQQICCSLDRRHVEAFWEVMNLKLRIEGEKKTTKGEGKQRDGKTGKREEGKAEVEVVMVEQRVLECRLEMGKRWPGGRVKVEDD